MTHRERVLAALQRQPVDRVPYVEHLFDPRAAVQIAGGVDKLADGPSAIAAMRWRSSAATHSRWAEERRKDAKHSGAQRASVRRVASQRPRDEGSERGYGAARGIGKRRC